MTTKTVKTKVINPRAWTTNHEMIYDVVPFVDDYNGELLCAKNIKWVDMLEMEAEGIYTPVNVMTCTGFEDKDGKLIFEKDIINFGYGLVGIVQFVFGKWVVEPVGIDDYYDELYRMAEHTKVLGNLYENPELLEEQNVN